MSFSVQTSNATRQLAFFNFSKLQSKEVEILQAGEKQERKCEALQKELDSRNDQLKREKESDEKVV